MPTPEKPATTTTGNAPAQGADPLVDHPAHYNSHPSGVEVIDLIEHLMTNVGSAVKYVLRAGLKDEPAREYAKARWFLQREVDRLTSGGTPSSRAPESTWKAVITHEPDSRVRMFLRLVRSGTYIPAIAILDDLIRARDER